MSKTRYFFGRKTTFIFTGHLVLVRISQLSKNFFGRIVLNRALSDAEFDGDSESHIEIPKMWNILELVHESQKMGRYIEHMVNKN